MTTPLPSSLDSATLARRLTQLAGDERTVQVEFLLHLDEFDHRRAYLEAGFGSLWDYCLRALHLREGAAGRRIGAMRVLRRFPRLEPALRDGRLCLSTASLLGQVLTDENLDELVERAANRTKADVEHLVVSIRPRPAPSDGVRKVTGTGPAGRGAGVIHDTVVLPLLSSADRPPCTSPVPAGVFQSGALGRPEHDAAHAAAPEAAAKRVASSRGETRPVAEDLWSIRVTLDAEGKKELDELKVLLSHKVPDGDLSAVLREAIRCALEKHGKRKGARAPARKRKDRAPTSAARAGKRVASGRTPIPAAVRREVWARDGGQCTYVARDGRRCESRWKLEPDHIVPAALGGAATVGNLALRCRAHNVLHAEEVFGRDHMERFRRTERVDAGAASSAGAGDDRAGVGGPPFPTPTAGEPIARYAA